MINGRNTHGPTHLYDYWCVIADAVDRAAIAGPAVDKDALEDVFAVRALCLEVAQYVHSVCKPLVQCLGRCQVSCAIKIGHKPFASVHVVPHANILSTTHRSSKLAWARACTCPLTPVDR